MLVSGQSDVRVPLREIAQPSENRRGQCRPIVVKTGTLLLGGQNAVSAASYLAESKGAYLLMANIAVQKAAGGEVGPSALLEEMERQFDEVRRRAFGLFEKRGGEFGHEMEDWFRAERETNGWPAAELTEVDSRFNLSMTLPGYDPREVQVTVTPREIIVHANLDPTKKPESGRCLWSEFQSNDVCRRIELPEAIDVEKTAATLEKGMLHVSAAKSAKVQPKAVEVKPA